MPATASGALLYGLVTTATQNITITNVTGGSTGTFNSGPTAWYHPAGNGAWANARLAASNSIVGSIDGAYVLSSTAGSTTVTFILSGTATNPAAYVYQASYTNGPIQAETPFAASQTGGGAIPLMGENDFVVQAINASSPVSSINQGYQISGNTAWLANTTNSAAPTWTTTPPSAVVNEMAFMEFPGPLTVHSQWVVFNRSQPAFGIGPDVCANSQNVSVTNGQLTLTTQRKLQTCAAIDSPPETNSYTGNEMAWRSLSFTGGTVEYYAKFGGRAGSGLWPNVWLIDATCQPSDPTGTDNNCSDGLGAQGEIDISEVDGDVTKLIQASHVGGASNLSCNPTVSDVTTNWHDYKLVWVPGISYTWYVDGVQTCQISADVLSRPAYLKITSQIWGAPNDSSLPWTTRINWIRVTNLSGTRIFDDEFSAGEDGDGADAR